VHLCEDIIVTYQLHGMKTSTSLDAFVDKETRTLHVCQKVLRNPLPAILTALSKLLFQERVIPEMVEWLSNPLQATVILNKNNYPKAPKQWKMKTRKLHQPVRSTVVVDPNMSDRQITRDYEQIHNVEKLETLPVLDAPAPVDDDEPEFQFLPDLRPLPTLAASSGQAEHTSESTHQKRLDDATSTPSQSSPRGPTTSDPLRSSAHNNDSNNGLRASRGDESESSSQLRTSEGRGPRPESATEVRPRHSDRAPISSTLDDQNHDQSPHPSRSTRVGDSSPTRAVAAPTSFQLSDVPYRECQVTEIDCSQELLASLSSSQQPNALSLWAERLVYELLKQQATEDCPVEWVNEKQESGLPYDIRMGENRFIEVKFTSHGELNNRPFPLSQHELHWAASCQYDIYRVFGTDPPRVVCLENLQQKIDQREVTLCLAVHQSDTPDLE